jgi:hypothetical protein
MGLTNDRPLVYGRVDRVKCDQNGFLKEDFFKGQDKISHQECFFTGRLLWPLLTVQ